MKITTATVDIKSIFEVFYIICVKNETKINSFRLFSTFNVTHNLYSPVSWEVKVNEYELKRPTFSCSSSFSEIF